MSSSHPTRPPRPPAAPSTAPAPAEVGTASLDDVTPLRADDPRPQHVPQLPPGVRLGRRGGAQRDASSRSARGLALPEPEGPSAFVYVERGPGAGQLAPLPLGTTRIGRASGSDLRLQHPSISRKHVQVEHAHGRLTVRDLGSQNGTSVNGTRLVAREPAELHAGDVVTLGNAVLRIRVPGAPVRHPEPTLPAECPDSGPAGQRGVRGWAWAVAALAVGLGLALVLWLR